MSIYTDSRSKPGQAPGGTDDRALFAKHFSDYTLEAWDETFDFEGKTFVRTISAGQAEKFPIIGRKRGALEHIPGEVIAGGGINHGEREISLDAILFDAVFIADIDEMIAHYPLVAPYAKQLGQSLASESNSRIARTMILASRQTDPQFDGGVAPSYHYHANMATDPVYLEEAAFKGLEFILKNDIGGGKPTYYLPWQQQLLLAKYTGIDTEATSGSGNRSAGTVGPIAGLTVKGTNSIPTANVTTGRTKYQGNFTNTVGVIANELAVGTLRRRGVVTTITPQPDRLGTLLIASKLEGHDWLRPDCSFEVAKAAR